jgi:ketosteroid isomerase-like protein
MNLNILFASMLALAPLSGMALAHESKAPAKVAAPQVNEKAKPAIAVVDQFSAAMKAGDLDRAGGLLADDVLILESGGAEHSRKEYLAGHAVQDAAFLKNAHVQITRRTAQMEGKVAWVGTQSELHASKDGKSLTMLSTETMVLRQAKAGWRITHIHWSSRPKR